MKLAVWARADGVHPQTAYRWFRQGTIPAPAWRLPSETILVAAPWQPAKRAGGAVRAGFRYDQRADLDRQVARRPGRA